VIDVHVREGHGGDVFPGKSCFGTRAREQAHGWLPRVPAPASTRMRSRLRPGHVWSIRAGLQLVRRTRESCTGCLRAARPPSSGRCWYRYLAKRAPSSPRGRRRPGRRCPSLAAPRRPLLR
jgi:hypothetical protein